MAKRSLLILCKGSWAVGNPVPGPWGLLGVLRGLGGLLGPRLLLGLLVVVRPGPPRCLGVAWVRLGSLGVARGRLGLPGVAWLGLAWLCFALLCFVLFCYFLLYSALW